MLRVPDITGEPMDNLELHGQIMRGLGRIEGKVDSLRDSFQRLRADHEAVESRVRGLENWKWYVIGIAASVGALASVVVGIILR